MIGLIKSVRYRGPIDLSFVAVILILGIWTKHGLPLHIRDQAAFCGFSLVNRAEDVQGGSITQHRMATVFWYVRGLTYIEYLQKEILCQSIEAVLKNLKGAVVPYRFGAIR